MALVINDRVRETTTVTGTGSATLLGAVTGYQSFSVIGNGNTTYYTIADQGGPNWEVGLGTWSTGGTLARTTVLASSNSGSLVNFTTGTKDVFVTYPSEKAVYLDGSGNITPSSVGPLTVTSLTDTGLTPTRVTYAGTGGLLQDSANMVFDGSTLTTLNSAYTGTLTGGTGIVNLGSGQFYKDASGNVGIGTSSPAGILDVSGAGNLVISNKTSAPTNSQSLPGVLNFSGSGWNTSIGPQPISGTVSLVGAYNGSTGQVSPSLAFSLQASNGSLTEQMRITSAGNVGIGTSSPGAKLMVYGASGASISLNNSTTTTASGTGFQLQGGTGGDAYIWNYSNSFTAFATNNTEAMRIDSSGNLILGQTSPVYSGKLTIIGGPSNPSANANGFALVANGAYGGGLLLVDGTNDWGFYDVGGTLQMAFGSSGGAMSSKLSLTNSGNLSVAGSISTGSGQNAYVSTGYVYDSNSSPITLRYIDVSGAYAGTWTNFNGYIGTTGDPAYGYVLLCKAYSSGGAVNYSGFTGFIYRRRGASYEGLENYACYVSVASAYLGNGVGGVNLGQPSWYIVSVTYGGQLYLAVRTDSNSAAYIDIAGAYTANFTPIVVADNTVSGETILKTLS